MWEDQFSRCVRNNDVLGALLVIPKIDINKTHMDISGHTPLSYCLSRNVEALVSPLIMLGADVNALDNNGYGPLHYVYWYPDSSVSLATTLLDAGAHVDMETKWGETSLHFAVWWDIPDLVRLYIDAGADWGLRNRNGQTPMEVAADGRSDQTRSILSSLGNKRERRC